MKKILCFATIFCSLFGLSVINTLAAVGDGGIARGRFQYYETDSILTARTFQSTIEECGGPPVGETEIYRVRFPNDNIMVFKEPGTYEEPMVWRRLGTGTGIYGHWIQIGGDIGTGGLVILNEDGRFVFLANSCHDDVTGTYITHDGQTVILYEDNTFYATEENGDPDTGIYSVSGNTITFTINEPGYVLILTGTISGETVNGTWFDSDGESGTWSMSKVE